MYIRRSEAHRDTGSQIVRRPAAGQVQTDVPVLELPPHVRQALADSVPAETRRKYDMWFGKANRWCQVDPWAVANGVTVLPMPSAAFTTWVQFLTTVVSDRTGQPYSVASLNQAVAAVVSYHEAVGESPPSTREARKLIRDHGARIAREVKRSAILTPDQILDVVRLDRCNPRRPGATAHDTLVAARNRFMVVVSFNAWDRRSEFAAAELPHFGVAEEPVPDATDGRTHRVLRWRFPKSKTDQGGEGADVFMPATGDDLCPVDAYGMWRAVLAGRGVVGGRALRSIDRWGNIGDGMTGHTINTLSKALVAEAGHAIDGYGRTFTAQGWRASGYSAATRAGASAEAKRRHGRWSPTSGVPDRVYDRAKDPVSDNPMAAVTAARTKGDPMHTGPLFRVHAASGGYVDFTDPGAAQAHVDTIGGRLEVVMPQPQPQPQTTRWGVVPNDGTDTHLSFPTEDAAREYAAQYPDAVVSELPPGAHR